MSDGVLFVLATLSVAWALSLEVYRWIARDNVWPMGRWLVERPGLTRLLVIAISVAALGSVLTLGSGAVVLVLVLGTLGAFMWVALLKVAAQSALLLAPATAMLLIAGQWFGI